MARGAASDRAPTARRSAGGAYGGREALRACGVDARASAAPGAWRVCGTIGAQGVAARRQDRIEQGAAACAKTTGERRLPASCAPNAWIIEPRRRPMSDAETGAPPREFRELRDLIVEKRDKMPKRLAQVANYTIEFPDDIAFGTVGRISEQAAVQPSTLVRFAKALGYSGFSELQAVFQQRLRDRPNNYEARLQSFDAHATGLSPAVALIDGFSQAAIRSVERLKERIKLDTLEEAARILALAETIYLIGLRRSYPVTSYLSYALGTLGARTVLVGSPNGVDRELLSFAGPRDAALAVSFTPYSATTIEYARQVAGQNTPLIAITDSPFSPLVFNTSVWFEVVEADFEGFRMLAATMTLATTLAVAVAEQRRVSGKQNLHSEGK
jgi:DNA-binding MurR/RpiR family transcriptional regulator